MESKKEIGARSGVATGAIPGHVVLKSMESMVCGRGLPCGLEKSEHAVIRT